jgi:hypothetical protein
MRRDNPRESDAREQEKPRQIRVPGFVAEQPIGLGDVIKSATSLLGIRPCTGCARRANRLNRALLFSPRRRE